jgi:acyl-CoA dehydrogenase
MITLTLFLLFSLLVGMVYFELSLRAFGVTVMLLLVMLAWGMHWYTLSSTLLLLLLLMLVISSVPWLRRMLITRPLFHWFAKSLPTMSETERIALEAGTVGWEKQLFSGAPDFAVLDAMGLPKLSKAERDFLAGPVARLCAMIDNWDITHNRHDMPEKMWRFLKQKGFFALIIPKKYGGKAFSAQAHAAIIARVAALSTSVATSITVPNSLGPAELLLHYGTKAQRDYYLPRLASGKEIPCFALTSPVAGSDATGIVDSGVVCYKKVKGVKTLGIRLNFSKRYITLAPIATLIGLAFKCYDPDGLLGDQSSLGITCALIPRGSKGVTIGMRHYPLDCAFLNGPIEGKDVFIELDAVIGGVEQLGQGWRMLMACLAAGRAISLPSLAVGGAHMATWVSAGYAQVRRQFRRPIGDFEGIQEPLARMAGTSLIMEATRQFTLAMIDRGEQPALASAISKYHCTELARKVLIDAMDIQGGKGICLGPSNSIGRLYQEIPICITVEGANILTRNMIIFGQGLMRAHPYLHQEMQAVSQGVTHGLKAFDDLIFQHINHVVRSKVQAFIYGLTRARGVVVRGYPKEVRRYYQYIVRFSTAFAFLVEMLLLLLGGKLKQRERLSARLADILSYLYQLSAVLNYAKSHRWQKSMMPGVHWACQTLLQQIEVQFDQCLRQMPSRFFAFSSRLIIFPLGRHCHKPKDKLEHSLAQAVQLDSGLRDWLAQSIDVSHGPLADLDRAWQQVMLSQGPQRKLDAAIKEGVIAADDAVRDQIKQAQELGYLSRDEASLLLTTQKYVRKVTDVDAFADVS